MPVRKISKGFSCGKYLPLISHLLELHLHSALFIRLHPIDNSVFHSSNMKRAAIYCRIPSYKSNPVSRRSISSSRPLSRNRSWSCNPLDSPPPALPAAGSGRAPNSAPDTSQLYRFLYIFLPFPGIGARGGGAGNPHPESSLIRAEPPPCKSDHQAGNGNDQTLLLSVCRQIIPLIQ